jgi:hypothetical protein
MDRFVVLWPVSSHFLHANLRINVPKSENYVKIFIRAHSGKVFGFSTKFCQKNFAKKKLPENPNRVESVNSIRLFWPKFSRKFPEKLNRLESDYFSAVLAEI